MGHPENHCHDDDGADNKNGDDDLVSPYRNEHCSNHKIPHSGSDGSAKRMAMMNLMKPVAQVQGVGAGKLQLENSKGETPVRIALDTGVTANLVLKLR